MTAPVTGAAGFIGSHLCDLLLARGESVIGLDDLSTGRVENLEGANLDPRFRFVEGDAADADVLEGTAGPRQSGSHGMVLPRFVAAALADEDLTVSGDGFQTRCFLPVHDAIEALMMLSHRTGSEPLVFNVGSAEQVRIVELAALVVAETGSSSGIAFVDARSRFGPDFEEPRDRLPDISRTTEAIGWKPCSSLRTIVRDTTAWSRRGDHADNHARPTQ